MIYYVHLVAITLSIALPSIVRPTFILSLLLHTNAFHIEHITKKRKKEEKHLMQFVILKENKKHCETVCVVMK